MRTGVAHLPLHSGRAPRWLFERMKKLAREIAVLLIEEYGPHEMLSRLSDPFWFQAFGGLLGFDWHSSGVTTTVGGALKEGLKGVDHCLGFYVGGGKGAVSRRTPAEIKDVCQEIGRDPEPLVYASRMSAKVDSAALQDGFQIYHHNFFFTKEGNWCVVQQGMNENTGYARRYHWLGQGVEDFVCEPHAAVCSDFVGSPLNMIARESSDCRDASAALAREKPEKVLSEMLKMEELFLPSRHHIIEEKDILPRNLYRILVRTYERQPQDFGSLLYTEGVGPRTIRALALASELIFGSKASCRDPVRFSFAHGGKDGHPYPVNRKSYDQTIEILRSVTSKAHIDRTEEIQAMKRLNHFYQA